MALLHNIHVCMLVGVDSPEGVTGPMVPLALSDQQAKLLKMTASHWHQDLSSKFPPPFSSLCLCWALHSTLLTSERGGSMR